MILVFPWWFFYWIFKKNLIEEQWRGIIGGHKNLSICLHKRVEWRASSAIISNFSSTWTSSKIIFFCKIQSQHNESEVRQWWEVQCKCDSISSTYMVFATMCQSLAPVRARLLYFARGLEMFYPVRDPSSTMLRWYIDMGAITLHCSRWWFVWDDLLAISGTFVFHCDFNVYCLVLLTLSSFLSISIHRWVQE